MIQNFFRRENEEKIVQWIKIIKITKIKITRNILQKVSSETTTRKTKKNQPITIHALPQITFLVFYLPFFSQGSTKPFQTIKPYLLTTFDSQVLRQTWEWRKSDCPDFDRWTRVKMMIVIVPYWVDTNSGSSSVLLSDVRIFKGFFVSCLTRHTSQWQCHYQTFDG